MCVVNPSDPTDIVRHGYDAMSHLYRRDGDNPVEYRPWLAALQRQLPAGASVLDLGCGCGIPVATALADRGHHVTGVDVSEVQITRARRLVPQATFVHADANGSPFQTALSTPSSASTRSSTCRSTNSPT
jgi:SAM-dependent methyltransferase